MRFLTPSSIAILAAVGLSRAAPVEVVHLAATPRLGYALQGSNHDALPVAAAAVAHEPRAADRPTSPHVGRGLSPTATGAGDNKQQQRRAPLPTSAPVILSPNATPNEIYDFYGPVPDTDEQLGPKPYKVQGAFFDWYQPEEVKAPTTPTLVARQDNPPVPTSQLPYPTFPSQYTSCQKCEPEYPKISSCAMASSAFQNGTTIFSDPTKYYSIIKCACADTFQAAYPQCLDCFQHTNQCWYLGTDPQGTQAPAIISNMRSICALGSALLGGVASTNQGGYNYTYTPSSPGTFTDVNKHGPGYIDQGAGSIFQSGASRNARGGATLPVIVTSVVAVVAMAALA